MVAGEGGYIIYVVILICIFMMTSSTGNFSALLRGIRRSPVNSPHKGQCRGALMLPLICARINGWVNNRGAGDLRRNRTHYDVIVMFKPNWIATYETRIRYMISWPAIPAGCLVIKSENILSRNVKSSMTSSSQNTSIKLIFVIRFWSQIEIIF